MTDKKIRSLDDLRKLKERTGDLTSARSEDDKVKIIIGMGTCGIAAGVTGLCRVSDGFELQTRHYANGLHTER